MELTGITPGSITEPPRELTPLPGRPDPQVTFPPGQAITPGRQNEVPAGERGASSFAPGRQDKLPGIGDTIDTLV